jgi:hypothetical protein
MLILTLLFANTFAQVIPTNGLVAYYPFNGNANDITVFANHGIVNGATLTTDRNGKANSAYSFNGSSSYIVSNAVFNNILGTKSRTVSFWLKTNSPTRQSAVLFGAQTACYAKFNVEVSQVSNASARLVTGCDAFEYPANVLNNNWNNIICVLDSVSATTGIAKIYLNGTLVGTTGAITVNTQSGNIYFGQDGNSHKLNGSIDDVCIWNRALTSAEITSVVNATRQTIIYVDKNSTVSATNGLINSPFKNIQTAIDYAIDGDTILLAPAVYYDSVRFSTKNLVLASNYIFNNDTNTINNTIIDGANLGKPIVILEMGQNISSKFIGITFRNGRSVPSGGGTFQFRNIGNGPSVGEIRNCNIINNVSTSWEGGAISAYYSGSVLFGGANGGPIQINNCVFKNNSSTQIGGCIRMFVSDIQISNCTFIGSTGSTGSAIHSWRSQPSISNSVFINNSNETICFTGDVIPTARPVLRNCTFYEKNKIVVLNAGVELYSINNIFNSPVSSAITTNNNAYFESNNLYNTINSIDKTSFTFSQAKFGIANFENPLTYNFNLNQNSIAIGAGVDSLFLNSIKIKSLSFDKNNVLRPQPINSKPDIGAYESNLAQPVRLDTITILSSFDSLTVPRTNIISIKTNNLTGYGIGSYQLKLNYNASKYRLDSISKIGTVSSNGTLTVNTNTTGLVNLSWASAADISNNLPLIKAYFTAIDSGKSSFTVTNAFFNTSSVTTILPKSVVNKFIYGDVDINAAIQAYDAMLALRYSVGMDPLPILDPLPWEPWRIKVASVDTSALVTANDASLILKYVVGMITKFPKRGIVSMPGHVTINFENNEIVVRSFEDLGGLNISFENNISEISEPSYIYNQNAISAVNKQINNYRIGMAFSEAPENGTVVLRIPLTFNHNQSLNMEIVENASKRIYQLNAVTGVNNIKNASIKIYPNPTNDFIYFEGLKEDNIVNIYDVQGKIVVTKLINEKGSIDLSGLNKGVYVVKVANSVQRIVKM